LVLLLKDTKIERIVDEECFVLAYIRGAESSSCAPARVRGGGIFHFWGNFSFLGKFLGYFCVNLLIYCFSRQEIFRINFPGGANSIVPRQILHLWYKSKISLRAAVISQMLSNIYKNNTIIKG